LLAIERNDSARLTRLLSIEEQQVDSSRAPRVDAEVHAAKPDRRA